jgi:hypothetical protein
MPSNLYGDNLNYTWMIFNMICIVCIKQKVRVGDWVVQKPPY